MSRKILEELCRTSLRQIHQEFVGLGKTFPSFKEANKALLTLGEDHYEPSEEVEPIVYSLRYHQGVEVKRRKPDSRGFIASTDATVVFSGKSGVILDIFLTESPIKYPVTRTYPLIKTSESELELFYYLDEKPQDPKLEASIQEIIERHVALLKQKIE